MTTAQTECAAAAHLPALEVTTLADRTSIWVCRCGRVRYEIPFDQPASDHDIGGRSSTANVATEDE